MFRFIESSECWEFSFTGNKRKRSKLHIPMFFLIRSYLEWVSLNYTNCMNFTHPATEVAPLSRGDQGRNFRMLRTKWSAEGWEVSIKQSEDQRAACSDVFPVQNKKTLSCKKRGQEAYGTYRFPLSICLPRKISGKEIDHNLPLTRIYERCSVFSSLSSQERDRGWVSFI